MSNTFGSSNLFGGSASSGAGGVPSTTSFGLRQRPTASSATAPTNTTNNGSGDENAHPNNVPLRTSNNMPVYGKWGAVSNVRAPPRMSLATGGTSPFVNRTQPMTQQQQQQSTGNNRTNNADAHHRSIVPVNERNEEDLSLWVLAYGFRNETHFRALYHRLESCGTITGRRGGLSCFGEGPIAEGGDQHNDNGNNWVAVRYESAMCAQKALCQHGHFISLGGSTMIIGVMPLNESDAAAKLGINVTSKGMAPSEQNLRLSQSRYYHDNNVNYRELKTEADIMLHEGGGGEQRGRGGIADDGMRSGLDSFCGKVLAWFFMWDTQT